MDEYPRFASTFEDTHFIVQVGNKELPLYVYDLDTLLEWEHRPDYLRSEHDLYVTLKREVDQLQILLLEWHGTQMTGPYDISDARWVPRPALFNAIVNYLSEKHGLG